jgi:hypothetical protein
MKAKIGILMLCVYCFLISNGQVTTADTLTKHGGENVTLCGIVKTVQSSEKVGGNGSIVTFTGDIPDKTYTAIISNKLNKSMDYKLESLIGKNICFSGKIKVNKGNAEIMVTKINDIYKAPLVKK